MGTTCAVCGVAVTGSDVMYAPDGRVVCPKDFANVDMNAAAASLAPAWRKTAIPGGIVGAIPFFIHVSSSSSSSVNGEVTSFVYRDWIAIICGVVAVLLGGATLWSARSETLRRGVAFAAGAGVLALGAYQIASGFGAFAAP